MSKKNLDTIDDNTSNDTVKRILPGYYSNKPMFKIIKQLKKVLGYYDAIPTTIELVFIDYIKECALNKITPEKALNESAKTFIVKKHNIISLNDIKSHVENFYILNVFNITDPYFRDLKSLLIDFNKMNNWKTKQGDKDLDAFNQVIENCKRTDRKLLKSKPEYHLLNYYRLHRNSIVHGVFDGEKQFKVSEKYFEDHLSKHQTYFHQVYKLNAPNKSTDIKFDDFLIYTRAIKYFNNLINNACFNLVESNLIEHALSNKKLSKKFNGYVNSKQSKKIKPLKKYLSEYFIIDDSPEIEEFYSNYFYEAANEK